jgi:peptidoglycan hydrolase-like protein with peptidoglycan-binding domain
MRAALRTITSTLVVGGLVSTGIAAAGPALAANGELPTSYVKARVLSTPVVGGDCVVGLEIRARGDRLGGEQIVLERRANPKSAWVGTSSVLSSSKRVIKVKVRAFSKWQFRAYHPASATAAADYSNVAVCKPRPLTSGIQSKQVKLVQKRLKKLNYRPASVSGRVDGNTTQAVFAFQKANGLKRTGVVTPALYKRIMTTKKKAKAPKWCKDNQRICIDISQQAAYLKANNGKRYAIPISSGGNYYYTDPRSGARDFARTPRGVYKVYTKQPGYTEGPLGGYYDFSAFLGGYGVHGSASVPAYAASHGCVRVPRSIEGWVYKNLPIGAVVNVHN